MDDQDDPKPSRKRKPGLQPAMPDPKFNGLPKKPERPRLVIYVEASIFHDMHELAYKNGRSVSGLGQVAIARLLSDFAAGRISFIEGTTPEQPIGRA